MKIGVLKERKAFENRVALTPAVVKDLIKKGFEVMIETDAGTLSSFSDEEYIQSGANIATSAALAADNQVVLKVNAFTEEEVLYINPGTVLISFMYAYTIPQLLVKLNEKRISSFSMDAVPR
ncbi:MAG: NAD(P)(+) transhydrogenase (Re/Si-specific) subunit alpha, partial [Saprospiraceae bacterium]